MPGISIDFPPRGITCRIAKWRTPPADACVTIFCAKRTIWRTRSRWFEKSTRGRAVFHDGESEVVPGLTLHRVGGHTAGLQILRGCGRERGWMVLAADASHLYSNFEQDRAFPVVYSVAEMLEGYQTALPAGRFARSHRAGTRSAGDEILSGAAVRTSRASSCAWTFRRRAEHAAAAHDILTALVQGETANGSTERRLCRRRTNGRPDVPPVDRGGKQPHDF